MIKRQTASVSSPSSSSSSSSSPPQILSRADMMAELQLLVRGSGKSMRQLGAEWGVDFHEISAVLQKEQYPGERLLDILGLREESTIMYVRGPAINGKRKIYRGLR